MTNSPTQPSGKKRSTAACWVEAMRLRTLPVSVAGVLMAAALALFHHTFRWPQVAICLLFATLAQIASNFANEYFDYRDGLDRKGRVGPRRGVTEGDIPPHAMRNAALGTLATASLVGCSLIYWGGWWLIAAGALIVLGAMAYSTGPYPLSRHGWGEVAVVIFFGIAPVTLTYWLQAGTCPTDVWLAALAIGLMGANVLIVNNYRDREDDKAVGKRTIAVRFGARFASTLYLFNGCAAAALTLPAYNTTVQYIIPALYLLLCITLWRKLCRLKNEALNPLLGQTALAMLGYTLLTLLSAVLPK